jgi:hypothetical protein
VQLGQAPQLEQDDVLCTSEFEGFLMFAAKPSYGLLHALKGNISQVGTGGTNSSADIPSGASISFVKCKKFKRRSFTGFCLLPLQIL